MRRFLCALFVFALLSIVPGAFAHSYDRDDSDYLPRYLVYPIHAVGIALEYAILRPIHWVVSQPNLNVIFGHESSPDDEYWAWRVTD